MLLIETDHYTIDATATLDVQVVSLRANRPLHPDQCKSQPIYRPELHVLEAPISSNKTNYTVKIPIT